MEEYIVQVATNDGSYFDILAGNHDPAIYWPEYLDYKKKVIDEYYRLQKKAQSLYGEMPAAPKKPITIKHRDWLKSDEFVRYNMKYEEWKTKYFSVAKPLPIIPKFTDWLVEYKNYTRPGNIKMVSLIED